jgi:hypothetical protein
MYMNNNNKGTALVHVLLVLILLATLGTFFISFSANEYLQAENSNKGTQAYYYARSGVDIVLRKFMDDLAGTYNSLPFGIYGSVNGTVGQRPLNDPLFPVLSNGKEIVAHVTATSRSDGGYNIKIDSTGTVQEIKKGIVYTFTYKPGSSTTDPLPPVDAINVNDNTGDEVVWYQTSNHNLQSIKDPEETTDMTVLVEDSVTQQSHNNVLMAQSMYFTGLNDSLTISKNQQLIMDCNFVSFLGDVDGEADDKKQEKTGALILNVNGSELPGENISVTQPNGSVVSGTTGKLYGVVFIGRQIRNSSSVLLGSTTQPGGYYYFPSGVDLTSSAGIASLIKIYDFNRIDTGKLKVTINTNSGSITEGIYE